MVHCALIADKSLATVVTVSPGDVLPPVPKLFEICLERCASLLEAADAADADASDEDGPPAWTKVLRLRVTELGHKHNIELARLLAGGGTVLDARVAALL